MAEMKRAVQAGYWNLLRYDPRLAAEGKNPLFVDSGQPLESYSDFILGEDRYNSLRLKFPERADVLFTEAEKLAKERYDKLVNQKKSYDK